MKIKNIVLTIVIILHGIFSLIFFKLFDHFYGERTSPFHIIIHIGDGLIQQVGEMLKQFLLSYHLSGLVDLVYHTFIYGRDSLILIEH